MFEHDFEHGKVSRQGCERPLDEYRFAIEHVDVGVGHLTMDEQRHPRALHRFEHGGQPRDVGHAVRGIGRRICRIELGSGEYTLGVAAHDLVRIGVVGEVARHQRREVEASGRGANAIAIGDRRRHAGHGRRKIGHHDRARKLAGRVPHDRRKHCAVAQMDVPVVGAANGECVDQVNRSG